MEAALYPFSCAFVRAFGLIVFLPFDYFTIGVGFRFIFAVLMGLSAYSYAANIHEITLASYFLEFMLGFIIALPLILLIQAADLWGDLFESLRGQTMGSLADPLFQGETSHLALLTKGLVWIGLISVGVLETLFSKYLSSFNLSALDVAMWQKCLLLFTDVFSSTLGVLIPFALLFLVIEIAAMFSAKVLPGVAMFSEIFSAKLLLAYLGLLAIIGIEPLSSLKITLQRIFIF